MIRLTFLGLASTVALAACQPGGGSPSGAAPAVEVTDLSCRPTPNGRDVTACYATLTSNTDDRLLAVSSPAATQVQMHQMEMSDGMMTMSEMPDGLALVAGEPARLGPGGDHIMLIGVTTPLAEGDLVSIAFTFEDAPSLGLRATVAEPPLEGAD